MNRFTQSKSFSFFFSQKQHWKEGGLGFGRLVLFLLFQFQSVGMGPVMQRDRGSIHVVGVQFYPQHWGWGISTVWHV